MSSRLTPLPAPRLASPVLTAAQRERFAREGYLVLEDFVPGAACDALRARALELVSGFDPETHRSIFTTDDQTRTTDDYFLDSGDKIHFFFEEGAFDARGQLRQPKERSINKIGHALHDREPVFDRFSRTPELERLVFDVGLDDPRLVQSMVIFKQPRIGGEVRCHQDSTFLHTQPESMLGLWFALEDAHLGNGCLWALPGGHLGGLRSRFVRGPDRTTRFEALPASEGPPWRDEDLVPLEVKKGAVILLDGRLPHMSHANVSEQSRHAYTLHVVGGGADYPNTNWLRRAPDFPARGFR